VTGGSRLYGNDRRAEDEAASAACGGPANRLGRLTRPLHRSTSCIRASAVKDPARIARYEFGAAISSPQTSDALQPGAESNGWRG